MGSCSIQLAVAAGYEVISTSSPKKFDYVKRLGACQVFDYNSTTLKEDLVTAFQNKTCAGAIVNGGLGMGDGSGPPMVEACAAVVSSSGLAHGNGMVAAAMVPSWNPSFAGVEVKFVEQLRGYTELASAVFHGYLSAALAQGSFVPLPEPEVGGHGLEAVQGAMDILKKGVSRTKIVVRM